MGRASKARLRSLLVVKGRNIAIEYRWAEARIERYGEIAAELVQSKVDVIVTTAPAFPAVQRATSVIPIVFALSPADPVATGFVASLADPAEFAQSLHESGNPFAHALRGRSRRARSSRRS
jgi:putative ABC transport system substrate-binding protein